MRILAAALLLLAPSAGAALKPFSTAAPGSVPGSVTYQGSLNLNGSPVSGVQTLEFKVFDAPAGGNALWDGGLQNILIADGLFTAQLSISTSALSGGAPRYLEVSVGGTPLVPREPLGAVPYALVAKAIEGFLDVSGGGLAVSSAPSGGLSLYVSSATGFVGIGTSNPQSLLDVRGVIGGGGPAGLFVAASGNVGVGTTSPSSPLTVSGSVQIAGSGSGLYFPDGTVMTSAGGGVVTGISNAGNAVVTSGTGGSGDVILKTPALEILRATYGGSVGIGTSSPGAKLHLSSGAVIIDGTSPGLSVGVSNFVVTGGRVGVGTSQPALLLDAAGAAQFGFGAAKSTITAAGNLQLVSGSTISFAGTLSLSTAPSAALTGIPALFIDAAGRVGLGNASPAATLDVAGSAQFGTAPAKSTFTAAGNLQLASGSTIAANGTLSFSTAPSAALAGAPSLFIGGSGFVGLGTSQPQSRLTIQDGNLQISTTAGNFGIVFEDGSFQATAAPPGAGFWTVSGANITPTAAGDVGIGTFAPAAKLDVQEAVNPFVMRIGTGTADFRLVVKTSGRVGIGTPSPSDLLQLGGGNLIVGPHAAHDLAAGVESVMISGNLVVDGTAVGNQAQFNLLGVGAAPSAANILNVIGQGTFTVTSSGYVGIGTPSPLAPLSVFGAHPGGSSSAMAMFGGKRWTLQRNGGDDVNAGAIDYEGFDGASLSIVGAGAASPNRNVRLYDSLGVGYSPPGAGVSAVFAGKVGIGTSNPQSALDVRGVIGGGGAGGLFIDATGKVGIGTTSPVNALDVNGIIGGGGASGLFIDASGRVGIGTTSPGQLLQVGAPANMAGGAQAGINVGISGGASVAASDGARTAALGADGAVAFVGTLTNHDLIFKANNAEKARLSAAGNLGVGTTSPNNTVDVSGSIGWGTSPATSTLATDQGGSIELGGNDTTVTPAGRTPYIDFHYGTGGIQDYNARIINAGNNRLDLVTLSAGGAVLTVNGPSVGIGTTNPGAKLEVSVSAVPSVKTLRLRAAASGSVDVFTSVGPASGGLTGNQICTGSGTPSSAQAQCLGYWDSSGNNIGCGASTASANRALCAVFGD